VGERRYTEEELALILNRAAERQEGANADAPRYSLTDIQEIAAGAGISPDHVSNVAMSLPDRPTQRDGGFLGAPSRFRFDASIDGELSDDAVAELVQLARREVGAQGEVVEALGTIEWKAQDSYGQTHVTVTRRGGRTSIGILSTHGDVVTAAATAGGMGTLLGSVFLSSAIGQLTALGSPTAVVTGITLATGLSWLTVGGLWRRYSRRTADRAATLGAALLDAARRAEDDRRITGDSPV
jgi:hypothetical protein